MKKTILFAAALMLVTVIPAKAQSITGYVDPGYSQTMSNVGASIRNYYDAKKECPSLTLITAAQRGNVVCVNELLAEENLNLYSLDALIHVFDVASTQDVRDRIYSRALTKMIVDSDTPDANRYARHHYVLDYHKYYDKDEPNYTKKKESYNVPQEVQQAIDAFRPVLWDYLVKHSGYKNKALSMVTEKILKGKAWAESQKSEEVSVMPPPDEATKKKLETSMTPYTAGFDQYLLKS